MRSFIVIVHHWDHNNSMENKVNMGSNMDRSSVCVCHTIKRLSTFRLARWINTIPICRESNAISHPDGLSLIEQYVISISYIGN